MTETKKNQIHEKHVPEHRVNIAEIPLLDDDLFARELGYQVCLAIADRLLRSGLLTAGETHVAQTFLLEQYRPPIGALLAEAG